MLFFLMNRRVKQLDKILRKLCVLNGMCKEKKVRCHQNNVVDSYIFVCFRLINGVQQYMGNRDTVQLMKFISRICKL